MQNNTYVAIMAGGVGSRFWPASREARPKQFLDILGVGKSLLQLTFERFTGLCSADHIFIVTNAAYKDLVMEQLPQLTKNQVICEPSRNNTAPCVAYTALKLENLDPRANVVVAPSDALILKEAAFINRLKTALEFTAAQDAICTLGIQPTRPDTGYGYIQYNGHASSENGVYKVEAFKEKPDPPTAERYLSSGDYLWNAGIFIFNVRTMLNAFQTYAAQGIYDILKPGSHYFNTPEERAFIDEYYPKTTSISIDYAIMEKAANVYTLPADIGWSDLGTWASLHTESTKDTYGNAINAGPTHLREVRNCLIRAPQNKLLVLRGLEDFVIADEGDVLLIYPKNKEQEIKYVTQELGNEGLHRFL